MFSLLPSWTDSTWKKIDLRNLTLVILTFFGWIVFPNSIFLQIWPLVGRLFFELSWNRSTCILQVLSICRLVVGRLVFDSYWNRSTSLLQLPSICMLAIGWLVFDLSCSWSTSRYSTLLLFELTQLVTQWCQCFLTKHPALTLCLIFGLFFNWYFLNHF